MLRNTSPLKYRQNRGAYCESLVLNKYLREGYSFVGKNQKIFGVEVDLILFKEIFFFIEVKSLSDESNMSFRLTNRQRDRLHYAQVEYSSQVGALVETHVCFVSKKKKIYSLLLENFF